MIQIQKGVFPQMAKKYNLALNPPKKKTELTKDSMLAFMKEMEKFCIDNDVHLNVYVISIVNLMDTLHKFLFITLTIILHHK